MAFQAMIKSAASAASPGPKCSPPGTRNRWKNAKKYNANQFVCPLSTRIKDAGITICHSRGRILFYTAGSRHGFEGMDTVCWHTKKVCIRTQQHFHPIKHILFSYRKIYWGRQTGWKTRPGSAGNANEAQTLCKRRVTAKFVQNWPIWIRNHKNLGLTQK